MVVFFEVNALAVGRFVLTHSRDIGKWMQAMHDVGHTVVIALPANQPQASYIAEQRCSGSYTELYNQCYAMVQGCLRKQDETGVKDGPYT